MQSLPWLYTESVSLVRNEVSQISLLSVGQVRVDLKRDLPGTETAGVKGQPSCSRAWHGYQAPWQRPCRLTCWRGAAATPDALPAPTHLPRSPSSASAGPTRCRPVVKSPAHVPSPPCWFKFGGGRRQACVRIFSPAASALKLLSHAQLFSPQLPALQS